MEVLRTEEDFYELAMSYFERAKGMGVRYCEVMVDVQRHTRRGVGIEVIFSALRRAREGGEKKFNVSFCDRELGKWLTCNRSRAVSSYPS